MFRMAKIGRAHVKFLPIHVTETTIAQLRRSVKLAEFQEGRRARTLSTQNISYGEARFLSENDHPFRAVQFASHSGLLCKSTIVRHLVQGSSLPNSHSITSGIALVSLQGRACVPGPKGLTKACGFIFRPSSGRYMVRFLNSIRRCRHVTASGGPLGCSTPRRTHGSLDHPDKLWPAIPAPSPR